MINSFLCVSLRRHANPEIKDFQKVEADTDWEAALLFAKMLDEEDQHMSIGEEREYIKVMNIHGQSKKFNVKCRMEPDFFLF